MKWYLKVLKQYADFNGRARRKEYWMFTLFHVLITYGLLFIFIAIGNTIETPQIALIALVYVLATLVPAIAVSVRRMHDIGKSGWYSLIPYYNLYLTCLDSEPGENKYGPNPKEEEKPILEKV